MSVLEARPPRRRSGRGDDGIVPKLAQAIYADRAFDRRPILADALEEAGATTPASLVTCEEKVLTSEGAGSSIF
jgi:hypothetical protein